MSQRAQARKAKMGLKSSLTNAREDVLVELGFEWATKKKGDNALWEKNLAMLRKFKEEHGHCNVPQKTPALGIWVNNSRQRKSALSKEKKAELDALGFTWVARK